MDLYSAKMSLSQPYYNPVPVETFLANELTPNSIQKPGRVINTVLTLTNSNIDLSHGLTTLKNTENINVLSDVIQTNSEASSVEFLGVFQ